MYKFQDSAICDMVSHAVQQSLMINAVEELRYIYIDRYVEPFLNILLSFGYGGVCTTV
jgi:hypothetical protein